MLRTSLEWSVCLLREYLKRNKIWMFGQSPNDIFQSNKVIRIENKQWRSSNVKKWKSLANVKKQQPPNNTAVLYWLESPLCSMEFTSNNKYKIAVLVFLYSNPQGKKKYGYFWHFALLSQCEEKSLPNMKTNLSHSWVGQRKHSGVFFFFKF